MKVSKTHFEQVPVETVKELVEPEIVEKERTDKAVTDEAQILEEGKTMTATFDIFEVEPDGRVMWRGSAAAFEEAQELARKLSSSGGREHIIFSPKTGKKVVIKPDGSTAEQEASQT